MSTDPAAEPWIVTHTHTVRSGQVVRWFRTMRQADAGTETMSASRDGVLVHAYLHQVPPALLATADGLRREMAAGRDVSHVATHRPRRGLYGDLEPITRTTTPTTEEATDA